MVRHREPRHAARFNRERGEEAGVVVHAPVARHGPVGERAGRWEEGREGGREGGREEECAARRRRRRRRRLAELALRRRRRRRRRLQRAVGGWNRAFLPPHCILAGAAAGHVRYGSASALLF